MKFLYLFGHPVAILLGSGVVLWFLISERGRKTGIAVVSITALLAAGAVFFKAFECPVSAGQCSAIPMTSVWTSVCVTTGNESAIMRLGGYYHLSAMAGGGAVCFDVAGLWNGGGREAPALPSQMM